MATTVRTALTSAWLVSSTPTVRIVIFRVNNVLKLLYFSGPRSMYPKIARDPLSSH